MSYIPERRSVMNYLGTWDASSNTPTLTDGTGSTGDFYKVIAGGTVNFGSGDITFFQDDYVIYNNSNEWEKLSNSNIIGEAEDSSYDDGLFTDFTKTTKTGTAVDRFNEVLASLAPSPPPALDNIFGNSTYNTGYLIIEPGNNNLSGAGYEPVNVGSITTNLNQVNVDESFSNSNPRLGIIDANTDITGTLNDDVAQGSDSSYSADSFKNADQGTLKLIVNGAQQDIIDLTTAGAVDNTNNGSNTGLNISDTSAVTFPNGDPLDIFQYRTGTFTVASTDMVNGWNYVRVEHDISGNINQTNYADWFVDDSTTQVNYGSENLHNISLSGSKNLSGVEYYQSGTAEYDITIDNAYKNTFVKTNSVQFIGTGCDISNEDLPDSNGNPIKTVTLSGKTATITADRLIDESILMQTKVLRTVQTETTSNGDGIGGILLDNKSSSSTRGDSGGEYNSGLEDFEDETYRLPSDLNFENDHSSALWDSTNSLEDGGNAGYNNGLQITEGKLVYPSNTSNKTVSSADYSAITNGPSGNPDYSTNISGDRVYYRYFYDPDPNSTTANFRMKLYGSGTFISESTTFSNGSDEIKVSIKLPNNETDWMDAYEDFSSGNHSTGDGARDSGNGLGRAFGIDWGLTVGTKNTANSYNKVYLRITVPQNWTGEINEINWEFS